MYTSSIDSSADCLIAKKNTKKNIIYLMKEELLLLTEECFATSDIKMNFSSPALLICF